RYPRIEQLNLPHVELYQLKINYNTLIEEKQANTKQRLSELANDIENYKTSAVVRTKKDFKIDEGTKVLEETGYEIAHYNLWLADISKESFNHITLQKLKVFDNTLKNIFQKITYNQSGQTVFNERYNLPQIRSIIRLSFSNKRTLEIKEETIKENAELLLIDRLEPAKKNEKLYPEDKDVQKILQLDKSDSIPTIDEQEIKSNMKKSKILL
ncbi:MAG: hypothetical protein ACP5DQ_13110, partial [Bacteroidales bacterium]